MSLFFIRAFLYKVFGFLPISVRALPNPSLGLTSMNKPNNPTFLGFKSRSQISKDSYKSLRLLGDLRCQSCCRHIPDKLFVHTDQLSRGGHFFGDGLVRSHEVQASGLSGVILRWICLPLT